MDAQQLTKVRKNTHGDWKEQSALADQLIHTTISSTNWYNMEPYQRIALVMILTKVSRICTGDASEPDHWDDLGGYARLGKQGHDE
jgi:hypothetical protein